MMMPNVFVLLLYLISTLVSRRVRGHLSSSSSTLSLLSAALLSPPRYDTDCSITGVAAAYLKSDLVACSNEGKNDSPYINAVCGTLDESGVPSRIHARSKPGAWPWRANASHRRKCAKEHIKGGNEENGEETGTPV